MQTVVLIDEDVNARIIATTLLEVRGVEVYSAADGREACEIVRTENAGVVVVDLTSSAARGLEAIRRLTGRFDPLPLALRPRIVALTDADSPDLERFASRVGADVVLRKPVPPTQFVLTVENLLQLPRLAVAQSA